MPKTVIHREIVDVLNDLPELIYLPLNSNPCQVTVLQRGISGYIPIKRHETPEAAQAQCDRLNGAGVTKAQLRAMECGARFGFHVPAADPLNHAD
jgi:hypothetical protein